jgi:Staphylococcal nuclease homologue
VPCATNWRISGNAPVLRTTQDKYTRTLADVRLLDGTNVNHTLVKDGRCGWYRKYAPGDTVLEGLEKDAREAKKGLWVDPHPVPPWEWRKRYRLRIYNSPPRAGKWFGLFSPVYRFRPRCKVKDCPSFSTWGSWATMRKQ